MTTRTQNPSASTEAPLLTKKQAAQQLALCQRSVENLMRAKSLAYVKIGRSVRFERSAVEALKKSCRVNAS